MSIIYQSFVERQKTYRKMDRLCRSIIISTFEISNLNILM